MYTEHLIPSVLDDTCLHWQLSRFAPISLAEMADVSLLDRIDTKYLLRISNLYAVLGQVRADYLILDINHVRLNRYHTVYFDEQDFTFYKQHHNKRANRYKVRARQYVDTNLAFFEVKHKTNKKRTIKTRLPLADGIDNPDTDIDAFIDAFVEHHVPVCSNHLEPKLWNDYLRLTLVGKMHPERVTIDLDLSFGHDQSQVNLPGFAIAEVKQAHFSQTSAFIRQMRQRGIRQISFSKYCAGVSLLYEGLKSNNFKPVMRKIQQLLQQEAGNAGFY